MGNLRRIDPVHPEKRIIDEAAAVIGRGGVVCFPTRYLYGLGADARNAQAVRKVFDIKRRLPDNPVPVIVSSLSDLDELVQDLPESATRLMEAFWPGRLTLVFRAAGNLPTSLTAGTGKIGIRLAAHPTAAALVRAVGKPLTATSANLSGRTGCFRIPDLDRDVAQGVDLILDAGDLEGGPGSTVVDVTADPPAILREGGIPAAEILSTLGIR